MKRAFSKIITCLLFIFVLMTGFVFTACGEDDQNAKITLSSKSVEILLGETEDDSATIMVRVFDAKDPTVSLDYDQTSVSITTEYLGSNATELKITALKICDIDVTVSAAKKSTSFHISAVIPVSSIKPTSNKLCVAYDNSLGGTFSLSSDLVVFSPEETGQKGLEFSLIEDYEGISISEDNVLTLAPNIEELPEVIYVNAISTAKGKENVRATLEIVVVPNIVPSQFGITITDASGAEVKDYYKLARNTKKENVLNLSVYIPTQENGLKILPTVKFKNNNLGLIVNDILQNHTADGVRYDFNFSFDKTNSTQLGTDDIWFEFYYEDYSYISTATNPITIETIDDITQIAYFVDGISTTEKVFDVYTSYPRGVQGLAIRFVAIPSTATTTQLTLRCNPGKVNVYDEGGKRIVTQDTTFTSGATFYFVAAANETADVSFRVYAKDENGAEKLSQTITLRPNIGATDLGFTDGNNVITNPTYYIENQEGGVNSQNVLFYVKPSSVDISNLTIQTTGTGFDIGNIEEYVDLYENGIKVGKIYSMKVIAQKDVNGNGKINIKFPTGYAVSCSVITFAKLNSVEVDIDSAFDQSTSIGDIFYDALGLRTLAIKNGHSIPLIYKSLADIDSVSYGFYDMQLKNAEDVYDKNSDYTKFNSLTEAQLSQLKFEKDSDIISSSYLRALQYVSPISVGKVWVEITFTGKQLNEEKQYVDINIVRYMMIEVYNPVTSVTVSTKNVLLYPYDEVGEQNRALSEKIISINLNEGALYPTYYRVDLDYINTGLDGTELFTIEQLESGDYKIFAKTRTYYEAGVAEKFNDATINISVENFNVVYKNQVRITMTSPTLVEEIETINVPLTGIYLSALAENSLDKTFRIMTNVLPSEALNKNLIYRFEPDYETPNDILSISQDGIITLNGEIGGTGYILLIPSDCIMLDENGEEIYRNGTSDIVVRIPITIADGTKEETAIHIGDLSEITNANLHYVLTQDVFDMNFVTLLEGKTFNGGLYGKLGEEEYTATITINGGSIFENLSETAIIKNINFAGISSGSGLVATTSSGTIENVSIGVWQDNSNVFVSSEVGTNESKYTGGIVGENKGTIKNSIFAGSIKGKIIGGLAGKNYGKIISSRVEIYNLPNGKQMSFNGTIVGGLVGTMEESSSIEKSFVYNYSKDEIATNLGGLVGQVNSIKISVKQSFANVGKDVNFYQSLSNEIDSASYENSIKLQNFADCYISYTQDDEAKFYAHMTNRNGVSTVITTNSYSNIFLGSTAIWNNVDANINNGFAYLNGVAQQKTLSAEQLQNLAITKTDLSMQENTYDQDGQTANIAIMFVYKTENVVLTTEEQSALISLNTISIADLIDSDYANGIIVSSSDKNIIEATASSIIVRNTGYTTLKFMSKYDYSQPAKVVNVLVVNQIMGYKISYGEFNLDNDSVLSIKNGGSQTITSSIKSTVVLTNRAVNLKQNDYDVSVLESKTSSDASFVVGRKLGSHIITSNFEAEQTKVVFALNLNTINNLNIISDEAKTALNSIIYSNNNIEILIKKAKGADKVEVVNIKNATISPMDVLNFNSYVVSDLKSTDEQLLCYVYDSEGMELSVEESMLGIETEFISENLDNTTGKYKLIYNVSVYVKDEYKSYNFDNEKYTIRLTTVSDKNVYTEIEVSVATQEIMRVDFNHYPKMYSNTSGTMYATYQPSNVLSPGDYGMLEVNLYPNYANYDYITVTADAINGQKLDLIALQKNESGSFSVANSRDFVFINGGIRIYRSSTSDANLGIFYIKTVAASTVQLDSIYTITISAFSEDIDSPLITDSFNLIIVPQEKAGISINGDTDTTFVLKGDTIVADIMVEKTQSSPTIQILTLDTLSSDSSASLAELVLVNENYGTKYKLYQATIKIAENANSFVIRATTSRIINNEIQYVNSDISVYTYEFMFDLKNTYLNNPTLNDVLVANKINPQLLDIVIGGKYYGTTNQESFETFIENKQYVSSSLRVNQNENLASDEYKTLKYNLYYLYTDENGVQKETAIYNTETNSFVDSDIVSFTENKNGNLTVLGLKNATQKMLLRIPYQIYVKTGFYTFDFEYEFEIKVEQYTDEDKPEKVKNAEEFIAMADEEIVEAKDYILMKDIVLYDWEAFENTSKISSLDGNGYTITIMNFKTDYENESTLNLALFKQINSNTTIKNLRVNIYHIGEVNVDTNLVKTFNYAPIAITNQGIITNSEVVAYKKATNVITPKNIGLHAVLPTVADIKSNISGFVIENTGSITNSRVGGTSLTEIKANSDSSVQKSYYNLQTFYISGKGEISGFVYNNAGLISSSYVDNVRIVNSTDIDYTTTTTGFATYNSGHISMSYVKSAKRTEAEIHATKYGIETAGISVGFVYDNSGTISDSYSNITLTNTSQNPGRTSSGFVYYNRTSGVISTSYSFSRIIGSTTTQMNFSGVDEWGEYLNNGKIENSYYYDGELDDNILSIEDEYGKTATRVTSVNVKDAFYGFSFETSGNANGIWKITSTGPELISANTPSYSVRYEAPGDETVLVYAVGYEYGSKANPIIIRDAKEFNEVLGNSKRSSVQAFYSNGYLYGSYRLVNNIYLDSLNSKIADENGVTDYKLTSSSMTLTGKYSANGTGSSVGKFDGNGLTIYGLALSDTGVANTTNFGLFAKLEQNAIVMNINLVLGAKNQENAVFGVEAKNIQYVGSLAGTVENSTVVNITVKSAYENTSDVTVRGRNVAGGVIGRVVGSSYISNLVAEDISVRAVLNPSTNELYNGSILNYNTYYRIDNSRKNENISYAGGVIGIVDYYTDATIKNEGFADIAVTSDPNVLMLKTKGVMKIAGGTVGGTIGYVGPLTLVQDLLLSLDKVEGINDDEIQSITTYGGLAGGLVGYNKGYLRQVRAEHEEIYQEEIEQNVNAYYRTVQRGNIDRGNEKFFASSGYKPYAIGGLVGLMQSGKIEKAYSKIHTTNDDTSYAGGIVGIVYDSSTGTSTENIRTKLEEVYAFGDVKANTNFSGNFGIGGIVGGLAQGRIIFEKVNALNYWGNWLVELSHESDEKLKYIYAFVGQSTSSDSSIDVENGSIRYSTFSSVKFQTESGINVLFEDSFQSNGSSVSAYYDIQNVNVDGEKIDVVFVGQEWEKETWERDDNELLPHMVFGYTGEYFYIREKSDLNLMRIYKEATFIIVGNEETGNGIVDIDSNFPAIAGFKGELIGKDASGKYGFTINGSMTHALFTNVQEATFKDFKIVGRGDNGQYNMNGVNNAMLVDIADSCTFSNLEFTDIFISSENDNTVNAAIVVSSAKGNVSFNQIKINNCKVKAKADTVTAGLLFANSTPSGTSISDVIINSSVDKEKNDLDIIAKNATVGALGGKISTQSTTTENVYTNVYYSNSTETIKDIKININSDSESANISSGLVFGFASNVNLGNIAYNNKVTYSIFSGNISYSVGDKVQNIQGLKNIGGLFGTTNNVNINYVQSNVNLSISNNESQNNIGGLIGNVEGETKVYSSVVGYVGGDKVNTIDINTCEGTNNIGGVVGDAPNAPLTLKNVYAYNDINFNSNISQQTTIGGFVGSGSNTSILAEQIDTQINITKYSLYAGSINISGKQKSDIALYVGGIIGDFNYRSDLLETNEISDAMFGGEIIFNNHSLENTATVFAGGIAGNVAENNLVKDCASFGDISICPNTSKHEKIGISGKGNVYVGGIVGQNQSSYNSTTTGEITTVNSGIVSNLSLTTIINLKDKTLLEGTIDICAIVGSHGEGVLYPDLNSENFNTYAHNVTLCTELSSVGQNIRYDESLNNNLITRLTGYRIIDGEQQLIDTSLFNTENSTKLAPKVIASINDISNDISKVPESRLYYYIVDDQNVKFTKADNPKTLVNTAVIADGVNILNSSNNAVFEKISADSFISGLVIRANIENNEPQHQVTLNDSIYVAGLATVNEGLVYSCNVTGVDIDGNAGVGTGFNDNAGTIISAHKPVGGLVGENKGTIKDCFTFVNITGYAESNTNIGGFVANNTGLIFSSYSSGQVELADNNNNNSEKQGLAFAFSNGPVYDCYSISKVLGNDSTKLLAFDNTEDEDIVNNSVYDIYAAENILNTKYYTLTDYLTGVESPSENQMIDITPNSFNNNDLFNFDNNLNINYGYPSFSINGYENTIYMHHKTSEWIKQDEIKQYQIPNIGVLEQLRYKQNDNINTYVLVNDIDVKPILKSSSKLTGDVLGNFFFPEFDFAATLDGKHNLNTHTIKNLPSISGLFNENTGTIENIILENRLINTSKTNTTEGEFGLLVNKNKGTIINVIIKDFNSSESIIYDNNLDDIIFGLIVGKNAGNIGDCHIETTKDYIEILVDKKTSSSKAIKATNITFGGIAGENVNSEITSNEYFGIKNCYLGANIYVNYASKITSSFSPNYYLGGIVGTTNGNAEVTTSYLASNVSFVTLSDTETNDNIDNNKASSVTAKIYVGGIVGRAENTSKISLAYTTENTFVKGGNKYSVQSSYVGGISGFGGNIVDCYNKAEVFASARMKCIRATYYEVSYDRIMFGTYDQRAYASGIANHNDITYLNDSVNYGEVKGGVKVTTLMGYFDFNDGWMVTRGVAMNVAVNVFKAGLAAVVVATITPGLYDDYFAWSTLISAGVAIVCLIIPQPYDAYYTDFTNYQLYSSTVGVSESYFQNCTEGLTIDAQEVINLLRNGLDISATRYISKANLSSTYLWDNSSQFASWSGGKLGENADGYIYPITSDQVSYLHNAYYNGIANKVSSGDDISYFSEMTSNHLYNENKSNYYKIIDDSFIYTYDVNRTPSNMIVYKYNTDIINVFGSQTSVSALNDNWIKADDGSWVVRDSVEIKTASFEELVENTSIDKNKNLIINISDEYYLKAVNNLVNNFDSYIEKENAKATTDITQNSKYQNFVDAFVNKTVSYTLEITNNIKVSSKWTPMGTTENPFVGTIQGRNKTISIDNITQQNYYSFIGYAQDATIKDLILNINLNAYTQNDYVGGFIAYSAGENKTTLTNCHFEKLIIVDYKTDSLNNITYGNQTIIGGYIGYAENSVDIYNSTVKAFDGSYYIHSQAKSNQEQTTSGYIGGVVGVFNGKTLEISGIKTPEIISEYSVNVVVGGLVGAIEKATDVLLGSKSAIKIDKPIQVVATTGIDEVIVGGVAGRVKNITTSFEVSNITIETYRISGDVSEEASSKVYVGGIVGVLGDENNAITLSVTNATLGKNSEMDYKFRLYITAGLYSSQKPMYAYAGDVVAYKGNENSQFSFSGEFNGKSIAISTYNYGTNIVISSDNVIEKADIDIDKVESQTVTREVKLSEKTRFNRDIIQNGIKTGYSAVTIITMKKQESSNTNNSIITFADGTTGYYGQYNYKQTYYIIYTNAMILNFDDDDVYYTVLDLNNNDITSSKNPVLYTEYIYQLDVYLGIGEYNLDTNYSINYTFNHIITNQFTLLTDELANDNNLKLDYRSLDKNTLFMPDPTKNNKFVYGVTELSKIKQHSGIVQDNIDESINYPVINKNIFIEVNDGIAYYQSPSIDVYSVSESSVDDNCENAQTSSINYTSAYFTIENVDNKLALNEIIPYGTVDAKNPIISLNNEVKQFNKDFVIEGFNDEQILKDSRSTISYEIIGDKSFFINETTNVEINETKIFGQYYSQGSDNYYIVTLLTDKNDSYYYYTDKVYKYDNGVKYLGEISYITYKQKTLYTSETERITRNGLFFPENVSIYNQINNLLPYGQVSEALPEIQVNSSHNLEIVVFNGENVTSSEYVKETTYIYEVSFNGRLKLSYTHSDDGDYEFIGNNNYTTYEVVKSEEKLYYINFNGIQKLENESISEDNNVLTIDGSEYFINTKQKEDTISHKYGKDILNISYITNVPYITVDGKDYIVYGKDSIKTISGYGLNITNEISINADILQLTVDGKKYNLITGEAIVENITLGPYSIGFVIEDGIRKYIISSLYTTNTLQIDNVSFDRDGTINGNIAETFVNKDNEEYTPVGNYITLEDEDLIVYVDGEKTTYNSKLETISKEYEVKGYNIINDYLNTKTIISKNENSIELSSTDDILLNDILSATLSEIIKVKEISDPETGLPISSDSIFANYDAEEKFVNIKGTYYTADLKEIKLSYNKHDTKAIETLVVAKSDGTAVVYISDNGQISINDGYTYNSSSTNLINIYYKDDYTPLSLVEINQAGSSTWYLDLQAIKVQPSVDVAYWISRIVGAHLTPTNVPLKVISSESYTKFIYNNSVVIETPAGYDEVNLFPWINNSYIFEVKGIDKDTIYYSSSGLRLYFTGQFNNVGDYKLVDGNSDIINVTSLSITEKDSSGKTISYKTIFMFSKEIEISYEGETSYCSFACFSSSSSMGNVSIESAVDTEMDGDEIKILGHNAIVTFSNIKDESGNVKQFDILSGMEITETQTA